MRKLDGFDVLELLGDQTPFVVFVTAYDEYAVQAFEANAVDHLLKPVDLERLEKAISKISLRIASEKPKNLNHLIFDPQREAEMLQRILVRDGSDVHVLAISSVSYIESADDYVAIQTESATHIKLDGLNKLQEKLDPRQF
ncbi:MAG: two-component system LytT family response regulator [Pseudohongiellaceae bacterium]|jgi:two-component system LytT family response regulator